MHQISPHTGAGNGAVRSAKWNRWSEVGVGLDL